MTELLERDGELGALAAALGRARGGRGSVVLVTGEAGIGKTSLVRAFREAADAEVLTGSCEPLAVPAPLAPLHDLAPALGGAFSQTLSGDAGTIARALLEALAARSPAVVVVEDIHWADAVTLDVLRVVARRIDRSTALLVLTYRDDEASAAGPRALAGDLASAANVIRIAPSPLSAGAVAALAAAAGVDGDELLAATGGNPFLVAESLAVPDRIPPTVRDAVLARTTRLSAGARGALDVAAVIGPNVDLQLLRRISGAEAAAIDECIDCGILVAREDAVGFRHELTRAALEEAISPPRRVLLHERVARALAEQARPEHARIAHHAEAAGLDDLVAEHAQAAAEEAEQVGAIHEALAQRERALAAGPPEARVELLLAVGALAYLADKPTRTIEVLRKVIASTDDTLTLSRAHRYLGRGFWLLDRWEDAAAETRASVEVLEGTPHTEELAIATAWLSGFLALGGMSSEAAAVAERAIAAAEAAGNDEALASATISLGLARGLGGLRDGLGHIRAGRELAIEHGLHSQVIRGYVNALVVAVTLRDYVEVDALFPAARAYLEERLFLSPLDDITQSYARSLLDRGRLDEAAAAIEEAPRANMVEGILTDLVEALVAARRGEPGAMAVLDRALATVVGAPDGFREGLVRLARAEVSWLDGDLAAGRAEAVAGLELDGMRRNPWVAGELAAWAMRCGAAAVPEIFYEGPFALELAGDWRAAVDAWRELGCPFDSALAALPGDDAGARAAVAELARTGAAGAVRAFARERAARGLSVPRGPRPRTRSDEHGLTEREREVLALIAAGRRNAEIAAALHVTQKTASHHVSACLRKLGAKSRTEAAAIWGARESKMGIPPDVPGHAAS